MESHPTHSVIGWRCAVDGTAVDIAEPTPWRCPRSTPIDRHHLLRIVTDPRRSADHVGAPLDGPTPFHRFDARLAWSASAAARGLDAAGRAAIITRLDDAVRRVDGVGFHTTPFLRSDELSDRLGFVDGGGVWVKDETGNVAGSQKARHLATILLHLLADEVLTGRPATDRAPLAIASCGNAALAAATLAAAVDWPIDVFVPTWMSDGFGDRLDRLGARIHRCERRAGDPPGDPAMHRFRAAVEEGAVPFTVQGPENALCLDGGRTIGWELAEQLTAVPNGLHAVFVQVGGGAFASCLAAGLVEEVPAAARPRVMAVQAEGCAPLDRAWRLGATADSDWAAVMTPWSDPSSLADGILDDETYDWIGVLEGLRATGGDTVVAPEPLIEDAWDLARAAGFDCSPTGSASLGGLLRALRDDGDWRGRNVAVMISGVRR